MKFNSNSNKLYNYNYSTGNAFFYFYQKKIPLGIILKWNEAVPCSLSPLHIDWGQFFVSLQT